MIPLPNKKSRTNAPMVAIVAAAIAFCTFAPTTPAQEAIRVETNQVLLPVIVIDKKQDRRISSDNTILLGAVREGNVQLERAILESIVIPGLNASDFQVFDDGKEQVIQSLTYRHAGPALFRDNRGYHDEVFGEGGGKWSSADWPLWMVGLPGLSRYLISYTLPDSAEGTCHQIKVNVDRPNALLFARREYCHLRDTAADPLKGTILARQMENYLSLAKDSEIPLTLLAFNFYADDGVERVHVAIDWSSQSLKRDLRAIRILGMVFTTDGRVAARISDHFEWTPAKSVYNHYDDRRKTRYETQLTLPAGEYNVRVVLNARTKFGRAETPVTVDSYDRKELGLSAVSLCKEVQDAFPYISQNQPKLPMRIVKPRLNYVPYVPLVSEDIEFKPTADTRFKKHATLYTYFDIYEPLLEGQSPAAVQFQMRIVDLKTGDLLSDSQPISASPYTKAGSSIIPVGRGMDISKLPIGSYRLDVRAADSTGKSTAWRSANFTVEQ